MNDHTYQDLYISKNNYDTERESNPESLCISDKHVNHYTAQTQVPGQLKIFLFNYFVTVVLGDFNQSSILGLGHNVSLETLMALLKIIIGKK